MKFYFKKITFIHHLRLFLTPGPRKINGFTNKIFFLYKEAYAQNAKICIKTPSLARKYLPIWPNGKKTDFGHFPFGHVATIKVSLKIGLDGFFGPIFIFEIIKLTYSLYKNLTSLSNPGGSKPGGPIFAPNVLI